MGETVSRGTSPSQILGTAGSKAVSVALVESFLRPHGLHFDQHDRRRWETYLQVFEEWAARVNLVSKRDRGHWIERHVLPSLALLTVVPLRRAQVVIDVGSGAGFPGLPLGLARRDCRFYLVESKRWRSLFLDEAVDRIGLTNIEVLPHRVESIAVRDRFADACDWVLARAVANLAALWGWASPLLKAEGRLVAYKGEKEVDREIGELFSNISAPLNVEVRGLPGRAGRTVVVLVGAKKMR